nr:3'-5' exonuclease [Lactobacillus amylovorus]
MSIYVKNGILHVPGAQDKLRQKGQEIPDFLSNYTMLDIETTGLS